MDGEKSSSYFKMGSVGKISLLNTISSYKICKSINLTKYSFLVAINELRSLINFKHRFIVKMLDYKFMDSSKPRIDIYLEYVGIPLSEYILKNNLSLTEKTILKNNIREAIDYIHLEGYYHGDLSTNNIMIDQNGNPKIIDFGNCMSQNSKPIFPPTIDVQDPLNRYEGIEMDIFALKVINYLIDNSTIPTKTIKSQFNLKENLSLKKLRINKIRNRVFDKQLIVNKKDISRELLISIEIYSDLINKYTESDLKLETIIKASNTLLGGNTDFKESFNVFEKNNFQYYNLLNNLNKNMCEVYYDLIKREDFNNKNQDYIILLISIIEKVNNKELKFNSFIRNILNSNFSMKDFLSTIQKLKKQLSINDPLFILLKDRNYDNPINLYTTLISH